MLWSAAVGSIKVSVGVAFFTVGVRVVVAKFVGVELVEVRVDSCAKVAVFF
jgi:hypothetical protein